MSQRNVTAILREMDTVERSKHLTTEQKEHHIKAYKKELEGLQGQLDLAPAPSTKTPPAKG